MTFESFKKITGQFVLQGYQPDGDSVRFIADDASLYADLHRSYKIIPSKKDGSVQLRLEGMDAPETHYGAAAQPYGDTARDRFLKALGFKSWSLSANGKTVESSTPASVAGAILTKGADIHGRPISYVLTAPKAKEIHASQALAVDGLKQTINFHMVAEGHAYPLLYSSTPLAHRTVFREAARLARDTRKGLWPRDETDLFTLDDRASIGPDGQLIFPKLFRRCTDYLKTAAFSHVGYNLDDWLLDNPVEDDKLFLELGHRHAEMSLHAVLQQRNHRIAFQADLLSVVFIEK